jgi:hypothetical protein
MSPEKEATAGKQEQSEEGYLGGAATGTILYRSMREDPAGGPMVGPSARTLGVRPNVDIQIIAGQVRPNTGGMSVAPDRPENLHPLRRPPAYGGSGKDPVWCIAVDLLGGDLRFQQDSATHGLIEPARAMPIDALQKALEATKLSWKKLP